jgi:hypothetical protein
MGDCPTLHLDINYSKGTACSKKGYGCKWTWDCLTLHLDINYSKGTACSKKGYGCKWTWETV